MQKIFAAPLKIIRGIGSAVYSLAIFVRNLPAFHDAILFQQTYELQQSHPNPLNRFGKKCFSQTDEDGITLEILKRLNALDSGVYAEFGVGDGTENNTLILAALGWRGFWVGGQDLAFDAQEIDQSRFGFTQAWITKDNIVSLSKTAIAKLNATNLTVISLDLDGNDLHLVEELLANELKPKLFIVEYNAKFPPPVEFTVAYNPQHTWAGDDYFGASLESFVRLFDKFDYKLVCCNSHTGANAFFVQTTYAEKFSDIPNDINDIYVGPRYHLYTKYGHKKSLKVIRKLFDSQ